MLCGLDLLINRCEAIWSKWREAASIERGGILVDLTKL